MKENTITKKKSNGRSYLKWSFFVLTFLITIVQLYSLIYKLPFDASMSNKKMGFFNLYLYNLTQSFSLWIPLVEFIVAQILLQVLFVSLIYFCTVQSCKLLRQQQHVLMFGIILWTAAQFSLLLGNLFLFPYSYYGLLLQPMMTSIFGYYLLISLFILAISVCVIAIILTIIASLKMHPRLGGTVLLIALGLLLLSTLLNEMHIPQKSNSKYPNVVLIMTDSVRPDYLNSKINNKYQLPHLHRLLHNSVFFPNAFTTLGRSTPGLVTMLTGRYPKNNGARFNLIENDQLKLSDSLPQVLKHYGYETLLFADSLQFINVDTAYGFDKVFSPEHGIYDFIFTFANDLPLSNLLMNTPVGQWLFPYNFANRVAYHTYTPDAFTCFFKHHLHFLKLNKPVFIVIDLTLPHWPYVWARQPNLPSIPDRYLDSLKALDGQLGELIKNLQQKNILQNAILVVASDHGDSFGVPGERYIQEGNYIGPKDRLSYITKYPYSIKSPRSSNAAVIGLDTSSGHGTDLLSASQLNTTLAFQFFGQQLPPRMINTRVALIDIAPTLLDFLNLPLLPNSDGLSLKPLMLNSQFDKNFMIRPLFLESEIDIPTIDVTQRNQSRSVIHHLIDQYADLYYIDLDNLQLVLKPQAVKKLLKEKQRAIMKDGWFLVHFPGTSHTQSQLINDSQQELAQCYYAFPIQNEKPGKKYICYLPQPTQPYYVLINLQSYQWQILFEKEAQQNPVFNKLLMDLKKFYGDELL